MTIMDCPSDENATHSQQCNQRLDLVQQVMQAKSKSNVNAVEMSAKSCLKSSSSCKSVKFVEYITVTECLHFMDYSDDEFLGTWYTDEEMLQSQIAYHKVLEKANSTSGNLAAHFALEQDDSLCLRGLEYKTPVGNRRREQNKRVAWQVVEREQYRQWDQGFKDPQALADEYQMATQHCVQKAILMAQEDRQAILQQYKYYEMDGLSVGSYKSLGSNHSGASTAGSPSLFNKKMPHHPAIAGGRRPMRSHGRVSRAA